MSLQLYLECRQAFDLCLTWDGPATRGPLPSTTPEQRGCHGNGTRTRSSESSHLVDSSMQINSSYCLAKGPEWGLPGPTHKVNQKMLSPREKKRQIVDRIDKKVGKGGICSRQVVHMEACIWLKRVLFFYSTHCSLTKPGVCITHNATWPLSVWLECVLC